MDSIFGNAIGTCNWCGTPGTPLTEYNGKDVCQACHTELLDYDNTEVIEQAYDDLHELILRADTYYPRES